MLSKVQLLANDFSVKLGILQSLVSSHAHSPVIKSHIERVKFCKQKFIYLDEYDQFMQDHVYLSLDRVKRSERKLIIALSKLSQCNDSSTDLITVKDIVSEYECFSLALPWNYTPPLLEFEKSAWYIPTSFPPDYYALEFKKCADLFWKNQGKSSADSYDVVIRHDYFFVQEKKGRIVLCQNVDSETTKLHYLNLRPLGGDMDLFVQHSVQVHRQPPLTTIKATTKDMLALAKERTRKAREMFAARKELAKSSPPAVVLC